MARPSTHAPEAPELLPSTDTAQTRGAIHDHEDFEIVLRRPFHAVFSDFVTRVDHASEAEPLDTHTRRLALLDCNRLLVPEFEKALAKIPGTTIVEVVQRCRTLADFEGIEWAIPEFLQARMEAALPTEWRAKITSEDNAMFAEGGIMYGTEIQTKLNDEGKLQRRPCIPDSLRHLVVRPTPIGNENIEVGKWYPLQMIAYFHGAHGCHNQSICGSAARGATSIVVSPTLHSREVDMGHTITYWVREDTAGNRAMRTSQRLGLPVRVLRNSWRSGPNYGYAPSVGIRYDGLYRITAVLLVNYTFIRYILQRVEGQTPLDEVMAARPSAEELRQYREYRDLFERVNKY